MFIGLGRLPTIRYAPVIFFLTLRHKLNDFWQLSNFFLTIRHKEEIRPSSKTAKNSDLSPYGIGIILENDIVLAMIG